MRTRFATLGLVALALALLVAGGQAWGAATAVPPTLRVQTIGQGTVTGASLNCGLGKLDCFASYGSDPENVTITAKPADGWTFANWDGGPCDGDVTTTCTRPVTGDANTETAVFTTTRAVSSVRLTVTPDDGGTVANDSTTYPIDCSTATSATPATDCTQTVPGGSTLTLHETPDPGLLFNGWGGACSGSNESCAVYLGSNHPVSASFVSSATTTLIVHVDGNGSVKGGGLDCSPGSTCTISEPPTATVKLTATPNSGYAFTGWSDDCLGEQTTCTVDMSADHEVTATFAPVVPVLLTVNGGGTVTGDGITCGPGPATCSGNATPDSTIQFVATPPTGSIVTWLGCTSASGTICNVAVTDNPIAVTATFSGGTGGTGGGGSFVQLTVTVTGDGYVSSTGAATIWCTAAGGAGCTATVQQNSSVSLHATPASLSSGDFSGWGGSCSGTPTSCLLSMSTAKSVSATFVGDNTTYPLKVSVNGGGSVSGGGINKCQTTGSAACTSPEAADANITIIATPTPGNAFSGWSGACTGTSSTCTVDMSQEQDVTATFSATAPSTDKLTLGITGAGTVTGGTAPCTGKGKPTTCSSSVKDGTTVDLKATPAKGYIFTGWSGACAGTKPVCAVVVNDNVAVSATFVVALASTKKPTSAKVRTGYRVTFRFSAAEAGRLTVTATHKGAKPVRVVKTVKAGRGLARITVKTRGRWVFTLSLRSKSGTHALRYRKTI